MKKILFFLITLIVGLTIFSCKKDALQESTLENVTHQQEINNDEEPHANYSDEDRKIINYMIENFNYSIDDIIVTDEFIFVEGDIMYPKGKSFWDNYTSKETISRVHYRSNYLVTQITTIPILLHNVSSDWRNAVIAAANEWNNLNGSIRFSVNSNPNHSTTVGINLQHYNYGSNMGHIIASAFHPTSSGYPGNMMYINDDYNGVLTASDKKFTMVHELGHAIGFEHTDGNHGSSITNVGWWCRTFSNSSSVMVAALPVGGWNGFSSCDVQAFNALY